MSRILNFMKFTDLPKDYAILDFFSDKSLSDFTQYYNDASSELPQDDEVSTFFNDKSVPDFTKNYKQLDVKVSPNQALGYGIGSRSPLFKTGTNLDLISSEVDPYSPADEFSLSQA